MRSSFALHPRGGGVNPSFGEGPAQDATPTPSSHDSAKCDDCIAVANHARAV